MFDKYQRFDMKKEPEYPKLRLLSYIISKIDGIKHKIKIDKSGFIPLKPLLSILTLCFIPSILEMI